MSEDQGGNRKNGEPTSLPNDDLEWRGVLEAPLLELDHNQLPDLPLPLSSTGGQERLGRSDSASSSSDDSV